MVSGGFGSEVVATYFVLSAEMSLEVGPSLLRGWFVLPSSDGMRVDACFLQGLECKCHCGGRRDGISSGGSDLLDGQDTFPHFLHGFVRIPWIRKFGPIFLQVRSVDVGGTAWSLFVRRGCSFDGRRGAGSESSLEFRKLRL